MKRILIINIALLLLLSGCKKGFLDVKPDKSLLVPTTLADMQALLDNTAVFNTTPSLAASADGDFYTTDAAFKTWLLDAERNSYTWSQDIWENFTPSDWNVPYQQIFYSNVVLDGLPSLTPDNTYNAIKGTALFSRAFAYYQLAQEFTLPYNPSSASTDLGLSIRASSDVTRHPPRATIQATYQQVLNDLLAARYLLPKTSTVKTRPTLAADYAMLSRAFLVMGDYLNAGRYADSALQQTSVLVDYNTLSTTATKPFPRALPSGNNEIIYYAAQISFSFITSTATVIDTTLYRSYAANDLRKSILFKAAGLSGTFKGDYTGAISQYSGITTDELYLIRAECNARGGNSGTAMADLNALLLKRWKTGTYVNQTAATPDAALALILTERRKELVGRNMRWTDLRRLNADSRFAVTLMRTVAGVNYSIAPGSKRYAYPLPLSEVSQGGGPQNDR